MNFYLKIFGELYEIEFEKGPNRFTHLDYDSFKSLGYFKRKRLIKSYVKWNNDAKRLYARSIAKKQCNCLIENQIYKFLIYKICFREC